MHPNEDRLRALYDHEIGEAEIEDIRSHLAACSSCRDRLAMITQRAEWVQNQLESLTPTPKEASLSPGAARSRMITNHSTYSQKIFHRINSQRYRIGTSYGQKENKPMFRTFINRRYRPVWAITFLVLILAVGMAFSPVRALANSFLGLFRAQRITVVEFNPANMPDENTIKKTVEDFEGLMSKQVTMEKTGEPRDVANANEASALAGIPVRLPASLAEQTQRITYQPAAHLKMQIDLPNLRAVLEALGRPDIQLPEELNGALVEFDFPGSVTAIYGQCEAHPDPDDAQPEVIEPSCITLVQMPSPTVSAPPGLDVAQIGEAFLQLLGMSREEATQFSQRVDWTSTIIIPIPRTGNTSYQEVLVDGVSGTLVQNTNIYYPEFTLMWVKRGILYALTGAGTSQGALEIIDSLK